VVKVVEKIKKGKNIYCVFAAFRENLIYFCVGDELDEVFYCF
jgi:hypothetical protein